MALALAAVSPAVEAKAQTCQRSDFEQVVDKAAIALSELNGRKTPVFQARLRQLKTKRGWSHADFIKYGTPFVQDPQIAEYDAKAGELLAKITNQGEQGAAAATPDCKLLAELRGTMQALVASQTSKWDYMFAKLDKALQE